MPSPSEPRQLTFALPHGESLAREDFLEGPSNATALSLVEQWPDWPDCVVAVVGPEGSGKSHLAAIWAALSGARIVSGRTLGDIHLPGAVATGAVAIEDVSASALDEPALFHLLNLVREQQASALITAATAPAAWAVTVPDLASRLRAIPIVQLAVPDDALLRAVLVKLFADRQLPVDEGVVGYLASRIERSFAAARAAVARLDSEALRLKRPVTRALAAEMLRASSDGLVS